MEHIKFLISVDCKWISQKTSLLYICLSFSCRTQQFLVMRSSGHFDVLTVGASFLLTPEQAGLEESGSLTEWLTDTLVLKHACTKSHAMRNVHLD